MSPPARLPARPGASVFPSGAHALSVAVIVVLLAAAVIWGGLVGLLLYRAL